MSVRACAGRALWILACFPVSVLAQQAPARHTTLGVEHGVESLDNNQADWAQTMVSAAYAGTDRRSLYGDWRRVERFDLIDSQITLGGFSPLGKRFGLALEASTSPDHRVLPENSFSADLSLDLAGGWVAHLAGRQSNYDEDDATVLQGELEFYVGVWRLAYTLAHGRLDSGDSGNSHIARGDWYYGGGSQAGLLFAAGSEATRLDPATVVVADVRSMSVAGRHWFGPSWGMAYALDWTEQGDFYTRQGGSLGLLFRF